MAENCAVEARPLINENFSSQHESNDEDDFVVRRKKKADIFSDDEIEKAVQEDVNKDLDKPDTTNMNLVSQTRRRIRIDESSDEEEEDVSQSKEEGVGQVFDDRILQDDQQLESNPEKHDVNAGEDSSQNESSDSDDEDAPPLRLFRNKNATRVTEGKNLSVQDDDTYDNEIDEDVLRPDPSEISDYQPTKRQSIPRRASMFALQSETQRLVRESSVNLPYHRPAPKKLSDFMKRPIIGNEKCDKVNKIPSKRVSDPAIVDDLPDIGTDEINSQKSTADGEEMSISNPSNTDENAEIPQPAEESLPKRPLTSRERLLKLLGPKLPKLTPRSLQKEPVLINFEEEDKKKEVDTGVMLLMKRFLKHASVGKENQKPKKDVQINIVRKEEKADGSGVELVPDVVTMSTNETEPMVENGYNLSALKKARSSGERRQMLKFQLTQKMKKRREMERKRREELHKLDNEEIEDEEEEEECELSGDDSDDDVQEDNVENPKPVENAEKCGNGIIDSSDESDDDTQPVEQSTITEPSMIDEVSQAKTVSDGSVLLYEDSTRSSTSMAWNKSGRITPALDRTCSDDSFYNPIIPLRQPEVSNGPNSSNIMKPKGEFDDSYFGNDSLSLSRPFRLEFEPSQSQILDSDGFLKQDSFTKPKKSAPLLPPGAEDDNAMTDCNMSELLDLCSAPFNATKSKDDGAVSQLINQTGSDVAGTQELLGLCTGGFSESQNQVSEKQSNILKLVNQADSTLSDSQDLLGLCSGNFPVSQSRKESDVEDIHESTRDAEFEKKDIVMEKDCDVSSVDENSRDLFKTPKVDESFGFNMLSGNAALSQQRTDKTNEPDGDTVDDDDEPITIVRKKRVIREKIIKGFLEDEAELSGSDKGSDDEDDEVGPDGYESDEPIEVLPATEEINRQLDKVHRKQVLEEDQRAIELLQEAFMGGDDFAPRERKFRWKNIDESISASTMNSDDEDAGEGPDWEVENKWRKMRLEREEFLRQNPVDELQSEDSLFLTLGRQAVLARQNSLAKDKENVQKSSTVEDDDLIDVSSVSMDGFNMKKRVGSFLNRPKAVLARLANFKELRYLNGPRNTDKMVFKAVSPTNKKVSKRKKMSDVGSSVNSLPVPKKSKSNITNEDSNSVFDFLYRN